LAIELIKSGIVGLDDILKGGIRKKSSILLSGQPGTGKSIFALQFILQGAKDNQPGIYITSEESIEAIREFAKSLGLDLDEFEQKGLITLMKQSITSKKILTLGALTAMIKRRDVQRVVLDSITLFKYGLEDKLSSFRKELLDFLDLMKESQVTLMCTSEKSGNDLDNPSYEPQDFLFEGLVVLMKIRKGSSFERVLHVAKMRGQDHFMNIFPFSIAPGGINVHKDQIPFSLIDKDFRSFEKNA
jgi:KaiC/GvpD/RAD55 family RecA-like ATPase